jgi:energy-coupling factor transporter transmembrane protein EcfT
VTSALGPSIAARVLGLLLLVTGIATAPLDRAASLLAAAATVGLLLALVRPEPRLLARRALPAAIGVAALALPIAFVAPERAALIACRALLALLAALAIASTIPSGRFGSALAALGVPAAFAAVVAGVLRQLDLLIAEGRRLAIARRLRGARGTAVSVELLAALLTRSAARAERVELAMRLRGHAEHASGTDVRLRPADAPAVVAALAASVLIHLAARG